MTLIILAIAWLLGIVGADLQPISIWPLGAVALIGGVGAVCAGRAPRLRLAMLIVANLEPEPRCAFRAVVCLRTVLRAT